MNLSLFDSDFLTQPANRCEVYHFHIYIEDYLEWPLTANNAHIKGVFMHEYIHYLQHLTTLCGISIAKQHNKLFCNYRLYFADNDKIPVPLTRTMVASDMNPFFDYFNKIKGDREYGDRIDQVRVSKEEILEARNENRAVRLDTFNEESKQWNGRGLEFGYYAIIESMADMVQRIYEPEVEHNKVPYLVIQKLCESIYPEVVQDSKMMIAFCTCALMSSNPGYEFFNVIDFAKTHPNMNGVTLYKEYVQTSYITFRNGKKVSIAKWFEYQFEEYDRTLEQALGVADYYSEAIESALRCAQTGDNLLLILLYDKNVSPDSYYQCLANYYGSPYIEAYNQTLYSGRKQMPQDVGAAIGLEMLFKALSSINNTNCPRLEQCIRLNNNSYDCVNGNQWNRDAMCPFKAAMHYFRLEGKTIEPYKA